MSVSEHGLVSTCVRIYSTARFELDTRKELLACSSTFLSRDEQTLACMTCLLSCMISQASHVTSMPRVNLRAFW